MAAILKKCSEGGWVAYLIVFLPSIATALLLFLLVLAWSGLSLWQTSRFGGAAAVAAHLILGSLVVAFTIAVGGAYFFNWGCSKGHIFACHQEVSFRISLMGLFPCGFPITGSILGLVWRRKR